MRPIRARPLSTSEEEAAARVASAAAQRRGAVVGSAMPADDEEEEETVGAAWLQGGAPPVTHDLNVDAFDGGESWGRQIRRRQ